jgi:hypothetical protein
MCDGSVLAVYSQAVDQQTNPAARSGAKPLWSPEIVKAMQVGQ